ncbi:ubiquitin carboxyl-terminal hydrolase 4-like [Protopterus annectens]|uniref:ubiquitin carboxyl-terminal hydrolase 4-like n=1 Tax=Protopterus annectens TaxID=7888 RepID=UPI001CFACDFF|nr:ubiquitin carboxyl-terminal hydrolase 4-like [Protopterus annectens]
MRSIFNIPAEKDTRLWNRYMSNTYELLSKPESTVQDAGLYQGQVLVIEQKNDDGTWPRQTPYTISSTTTSRNVGVSSSSADSPSATSSSTMVNGECFNSSGFSSNFSIGRGGSSSSYNSSYSYRESSSQTQPGLCGLSNLGNTCFMNSALQCLSNTPPLTDYFLKGEYWGEINKENPLGMMGKIAEAYGELIKQMWSGRHSYVAPRDFKMKVGSFAPQFSGYQQQDSQELLAFLLDGLHEDLNRVKKKPYLYITDANNRPDKVVAEESWRNHRLRNDSVIVDIFHGLFKSTLVCPECSKISVTFDPFCYLTLPLPMKKDRVMEVCLVSTDPLSRPVQYRVIVPKMGAVNDLCTALSKLSGVPADKMVVTDVYNHRFHKIYQMDEGLSHILDRDAIFILYIKTCEKDSSSDEQTADSEVCNGPIDTCEGDEEMDHQGLSCESEDGHSEGSEKDASEEVENITSNSPKKPTTQKSKSLFSVSVVNSYGVSDINSFGEGKLPKLNSHSIIAVEWDSETKKQYYEELEPESFEKHDSMLQPQKKKTAVALEECIGLFTTMETLGEHDPWYCPNCKKHQQATKKFDLWYLPPILVVHLKRFSYNRYWRDKLDTIVNFPIRNLDMSEFVCDPEAGPCVYDLIAVSNHYGGMGGGHYTAYAKNKIDQKWYYFDDSSVSIASEDQIVTKAAYVLFYQRRDSQITTSREEKEEKEEEEGKEEEEPEEEDVCEDFMDTN